MDENTAILRARRFLQEHGVASAPVDVMALAAAEGFEVKFKDLPDGEAGSTLLRGGRRIILVNENEPPMRQRFTILHEIAHHVLVLPSVHGKADAPVDEAFKGQSKRPPEEVACDVFASECLVPLALIRPLTEDRSFGVDTVVDLANSFEASQHCVASQFVKASAECLAFVVSQDGRITLAFPSNALRSAGVHINRGTAAPRGSAAERVSKDSADGAVTKAELEGTVWSHADSAARFSVYEEASFYAPKKRTYSFLTFEELEAPPQTQWAGAHRDHEELLPELTGELTWKSRKR
ncbi:MAG TPA: ImmA/IrrE family metallo-endopeptidase [Frateuria sp.]|uniref:ImmA/IrrE family metallo-endopeptidase n=1 Tax=Frateuria sp. TaxID=2211372 RepID=UPI002DE507CF|nr:ImmA/IrrE family metallo-endopeptidase [Frateuria sp.]